MTSESKVITMCGGKTEPDTKNYESRGHTLRRTLQILEGFLACGAGEGCGLETNGPDPDVHLVYVATN